MRELKFRLRSPIDKIVGYEKWFLGSMDSKNFYIAEPCWLYSKDGEFWNPKKIDHRKKDQFTGLKDKNGKEIYEGDVAKITTALFPETKLDTYTDISVMEFCEKTAQFKFMVKNSLLEGDEIPVISVEVIGNIYQNPDFLTTPK